MRFEAVEERSTDNRGWSVWENDGSEDGRLVAARMTREDAIRVAALLNGSSGMGGGD